MASPAVLVDISVRPDTSAILIYSSTDANGWKTSKIMVARSQPSYTPPRASLYMEDMRELDGKKGAIISDESLEQRGIDGLLQPGAPFVFYDVALFILPPPPPELATLPPEILNMVGTYLDEAASTCLGLTSRQFHILHRSSHPDPVSLLLYSDHLDQDWIIPAGHSLAGRQLGVLLARWLLRVGRDALRREGEDGADPDVLAQSLQRLQLRTQQRLDRGYEGPGWGSGWGSG